MLHLTTLQLEAIKREVEYQRARVSTMEMNTHTALQLVGMAQELDASKPRLEAPGNGDPIPPGIPEM